MLSELDHHGTSGHRGCRDKNSLAFLNLTHIFKPKYAVNPVRPITDKYHSYGSDLSTLALTLDSGITSSSPQWSNALTISPFAYFPDLGSSTSAKPNVRIGSPFSKGGIYYLIGSWPPLIHNLWVGSLERYNNLTFNSPSWTAGTCASTNSKVGSRFSPGQVDRTGWRILEDDFRYHFSEKMIFG